MNLSIGLADKITVRREHFGSALLTILAVVLAIAGAVHMYRGSLGWTNYWGALVYAPFAVVIGLLMIVVAFKKPSRRRRKRDRSGFSWNK